MHSKTSDKGLTKDGRVRSRRPGGGRPPKHGEQTRPLRVPLSVTAEQISSIPELIGILDHWEEQVILNPPDRGNNPRYWYLKQCLDEIRALGF
jgi:hypothetical protein